ncbi:MAG: metallopeptidase TldD-related protein [Anaeroplasma sp.]
MINSIIKILNSKEEISDYKINIVRKESNELFYVHKSLETIRATKTTDISVTIYVKHDEYLGDSSFYVYASSTEKDLNHKINLAIEKALLINNELYNLPDGGMENLELETNFKNYSMMDLAEVISNSVFKADSYENGSLNAVEIFVNKYEEQIINSKGVDKTEIKYDAMIEAIPTWNGEQSVELYEVYKFNELNEEEIVREIDEKMREVKARYEAKKPTDALNCNVVLNANELSSLFSEYTNELNYASIYNKQNLHKISDLIQKNPNNDKINIFMRKKVIGSPNSREFDNDGVTLIDKKVIEDGKVVSYYGNNRYAQYLNMEVTGNLPCIEVLPGNTSYKNFGDYFECISMSGLQVDLFNDYIGGEVRLGYYHNNGKIVPITGVSISGKLSEVIEDVILSSEVKTSNRYYGPEKALFKGFKIL